MVADNLRAFIRLPQPVLSEALGMCRYYVVMLETVFALTRFQRVWSQEPDGDLLTGLGLAWTHASLPASNPRCAHLGCVDCTVQFSSRCKCEKHVAALPHHFGCLDSSDLLSPPPSSFPSPVPGLPERGGGDHQAGSSRLHDITAAYIHMLSGRALHAKLELQRQHSLFISSRNTKQNITKI